MMFAIILAEMLSPQDFTLLRILDLAFSGLDSS